MEIEITYEKEDWLRFQAFLENEISKRIKTTEDNVVVNVVVWAFVGAFAMFVYRQFYEFHWPTAGFVAAIAVVIYMSFVRHMRRFKDACAPSEAGGFIGSHSFVVTESGISSKGNRYKGFNDWSGVIEIVRDSGLIMLFIDTVQAYVFPEHKIDNPDAFYDYVKECKQQFNSDDSTRG
jgi:hypothetical protein